MRRQFCESAEWLVGRITELHPGNFRRQFFPEAVAFEDRLRAVGGVQLSQGAGQMMLHRVAGNAECGRDFLERLAPLAAVQDLPLPLA